MFARQHCILCGREEDEDGGGGIDGRAEKVDTDTMECFQENNETFVENVARQWKVIHVPLPYPWKHIKQLTTGVLVTGKLVCRV